MELIAWWQGENINKNLLHIVISTLKKKHHIGARLDEVMGKDGRMRKPAMCRVVRRTRQAASPGGETPRSCD